MGDFDKPCCMLTTLIVFISCILLGFSFDTLDPTEMALKYNGNTLELYSDVTYGANVGEGGRFFVGLGQSFYRFSKTFQKITMSTYSYEADANDIGCRTQDGLPIYLAVSIQYKFKKDPKELYALYRAYGMNHDAFFIRFARSSIRDSASLYLANAYFTQRKAISAKILDDLKLAFSNQHVDIVDLQLLEIEIPRSLKSAIEKTAIANQEIGQALFDQAALRISADTKVLQAKQENFVTVINAEATAVRLNITANAEAQKVSIINAAEQAAFGNLKSTLNMTNAEFLKFTYLDTLGSNSALKTILNVDLPANTKLN